MFNNVVLTRHITENYSEFTANSLVEKKPIQNWPATLGEKSVRVINRESNGGAKPLKVMVAYGGTGRATLEILRNCRNLSIDHTDVTANTLQVLERLLDDSALQWLQQTEGTLTEALQYCLQQGETKETLLSGKGNTINYFQADYTNLRPQFDGYDVIVIDLRFKDSADELKHVTSKLKVGGVLILGSIDDFKINQYGEKHSLATLHSYYALMETESSGAFPHIYRETRNKHQYAISYFSTWRKQRDITSQGSEQPQSRLDSATLTTDEYYEHESVLTPYSQFHFGPGFLGVKNFPLRMAEVCIEFVRKYGVSRKVALDAGCGPGRTAIELCSTFEKVEGYDYSHSFVDMIQKEKEKRKITNLLAYQGDSHKQKEICQSKQFDLILGCNLIDRLHSPEEWVIQSKTMLTETGLLIISSPYTWKPEHTDPAKYIGGFMKDGEDYYTVDGLSKMLGPELHLLEELKVPFVIPDVDGTYQYTYSNCTVFGAEQLLGKK